MENSREGRASNTGCSVTEGALDKTSNRNQLCLTSVRDLTPVGLY